MNKNFFFGMALLLCSACASRTEEFVVRGSFPGLRDGMAVALRNMEGEGTFAVDTVRDGKFELRGAVVSPRYCNLLIYTGEQNASSGMGRMVNTYLFLDNSELTVEVAHLDSMEFVHPFMAEFAVPKARVEGGALQREYYEYQDALLPLKLALSKADNDVAMLNLKSEQERYAPEVFDRQFDELYPRRQAVRRPVVLKMVEKARSLYKGAPYKEIELTDAEGRTVKLSQYLQPDRYTLVDFWASWCGPCRWAIPKVEQLYKRYDRSRLTVVSVSFDQKQADWEKAMKEEAMPWMQLWAGSREQMTAAQQAYHISGIPRLMLIAPDGAIVFSGNNADALRLAVEKYLGK